MCTKCRFALVNKDICRPLTVQESPFVECTAGMPIIDISLAPHLHSNQQIKDILLAKNFDSTNLCSYLSFTLPRSNISTPAVNFQSLYYNG